MVPHSLCSSITAIFNAEETLFSLCITMPALFSRTTMPALRERITEKIVSSKFDVKKWNADSDVERIE